MFLRTLQFEKEPYNSSLNIFQSMILSRPVVSTGRIYDLDRKKIISKLDEKGRGLQRLKRQY